MDPFQAVREAYEGTPIIRYLATTIVDGSAHVDALERATAFFGYRSDRPMEELAEGPKVALPKAFGDLGWAAPDVLDQLGAADSVYFDTISQLVVNPWSKGRVVLFGDAAWCVTLFAGFGSSLAVAGAHQLGAALERHPDDLQTALTECETTLRPEAEKKQKLGRQVKACTHRPIRSASGCATSRSG